ncbi:beat protein, putative [Pediculus humanus corporis]|uniref:Beat protein, putative n=1 Tax=Pediculus humanus subsp. corporis TaxID=121224 RepID=E0VPT6_PEDHC|nr:beat protein, putative [Pediculus humanus corporis]EEB15392.1 beat protein, putative [Pediculus humanus corporis]
MPRRLGGNVSCEVTTDAPSFKTRQAKAYLNVVSRPKDRPELHVNKDKYNVGDTLFANCTSFPSKPPASLSFYINNSPARS